MASGAVARCQLVEDAFSSSAGIYVGGTTTTTIGAVGDSRFDGSVYAPRAAVAYVGNAEIVGSIFARRIDGVGTLTVRYGDPVVPPSSCNPPPSDSGSGDDGSVL